VSLADGGGDEQKLDRLTMLADPRQSRLFLINIGRIASGGGTSTCDARRRNGLALLPAAFECLGVRIFALGDFEPNSVPSDLARVTAVMTGNPFSLWRSESIAASHAEANVGVVFLGGAWLDEDILILALQALQLGYDVRVLADISLARYEADRRLVLDRLAVHGALVTTVRQALLEWATQADDPSVQTKILQHLS
jgi:hypothetical protein